MSYTYYKTAFEGIRMPFAFVDLDKFDQNIAAILQRAGDKKIRIVSKSIRCLSLLKRILQANAQYQGIMAYSAAEAVWLANNGFDDILVAYPCIDKNEIEQVMAMVAQGKKIYLMTDSLAHLTLLENMAAKSRIILPICVDVDLSMPFMGIHFGVHRSSIKQLSDLEVYLNNLKSCKHLDLQGLMGYEAQIAGIGNKQRGKKLFSMAVRYLQKRSIPLLRKKRADFLFLIREYGINLVFVNGGGTGSLESTIQEAGITEVAVGSGFYAPTLFDQYTQFQHAPAAAYAIAITRQAKANIYTCLGGGYTASGAAGIDKVPMPYLPEGCALDINEQAGEVQTPIHYKGKVSLKIGDPIFMRHAKAGELCERFNELYLLSKGQIIDTVPTYRGQGQCFL